ncbi:MAG: cyanophycin synthetase, partial [Candidatus Omnitrophota bacterium]
ESASDENSNIFDLSGLFKERKGLKTSLIGSHQVINAAVAIGIIEAFGIKGIAISEKAIRDGIRDSKWPGRLEVVGKKPFVLLDGAHNRASAGTLIAAVKKIFKYKRLILVLGVSKDKDVRGMLAELLPAASKIVLTKSKVANRALDPSKMREEISAMGHDAKDVVLTSDTGEALDRALSMADSEDLVLITGSLFIVGEIKEHYQRCANII